MLAGQKPPAHRPVLALVLVFAGQMVLPEKKCFQEQKCFPFFPRKKDFVAPLWSHPAAQAGLKKKDPGLEICADLERPFAARPARGTNSSQRQEL